MSFGALLFLAAGVLWLQGMVISLAALYALRERLRARWDGMLQLERLWVERWLELGGEMAPSDASVLGRVKDGLAARLLPEWTESVAAVRLLRAELDACVLRLEGQCSATGLKPGGPPLAGARAHAGVLALRVGNAREEFDRAVEEYEARRCQAQRWGWSGIGPWMKVEPHSAVGRSPIPS